MKVCLINPPFTERFCRGARWQASSKGTALWMPIWLIYCAGMVERAGHQIRLIDSPAKNQTRENLVKEVREFDPGLIVIYTATGSILNDLEITGLLKKACPRALTALTGPHVSVLAEDTLRREPAVDYVVRREFDLPIVNMADRLDEGGSPDDLESLSYLSEGQYIENPMAPPMEDLDQLPFSIEVVDKHLNIRDYHMDYLLYPWIQTYFGRGCHGRCIFCLWPQTLMGRRYRQRSMDSIFAELAYIKRRAPHVQELMIDDDTFTHGKERVEEFCERKLSEGYPINWTANARANLTDVNTLKLMKRAGCRALVVGYETGSREILKTIRKGVTLERMEAFAAAAKQADIQVHGDFIIGLPGETKETIEETLQAALRLKPSTMQVSIAMPLPGTEFYDWLQKEGYLRSEDFGQYLTEQGAQNVLMDYPELSAQDMKDAMRHILARYYLRPGYIGGALKRIAKDPREAVKFFFAGKEFMKYLLTSR
jgi:anaerobic magnesium-protoporphyrin IX monomethyl ester cyclase